MSRLVPGALWVAVARGSADPSARTFTGLELVLRAGRQTQHTATAKNGAERREGLKGKTLPYWETPLGRRLWLLRRDINGPNFAIGLAEDGFSALAAAARASTACGDRSSRGADGSARL